MASVVKRFLKMKNLLYLGFLAIFGIEVKNIGLTYMQVEKHDGYFYMHSDTSFKLNSQNSFRFND